MGYFLDVLALQNIDDVVFDDFAVLKVDQVDDCHCGLTSKSDGGYLAQVVFSIETDGFLFEEMILDFLEGSLGWYKEVVFSFKSELLESEVF